MSSSSHRAESCYLSAIDPSIAQVSCTYFGEYCGLVGLYCGLVGLALLFDCGDVGEYPFCAGLVGL